ncbi:MAG: tRNA (guanosine(46)-N7)-methyltransferase TrmB [Desulfuromonadales bacterium]|nr:tRNA (guanosine(46)-N7)-methyltransferase TrmB [Desulfuromonadales bacterium]
MTQRMIEILSPAFVSKEQLSRCEDLNDLFEQRQPLALEIGCGTGHFITAMAQRHPATNFLAIDIYNKGCFKTCKKIDRLGLVNIRVLRIEACHLIANHLQRESLSAVYINCPDPWPKKRHRDRRLVNHSFLQSLSLYLQPKADLYFCTDVPDYARQVAELIPLAAGLRNLLDAPFVTDLPNYPTSKYMQRFLDLGQPIHFIHLQRRPDFDLSSVPEPKLFSGFCPSFLNRHHA